MNGPNDLKLVEISDPPVVGNTLYAEQSLGGDKAVYLLLCPSDGDPTTDGASMELKRDAATQLRDWLNAVLE
jgi:hypothetical protein